MSASKNLLLTLVTAGLLASCTDAEPEQKKPMAPGDVYRFYSISGEEGRDWATAYFQFRRNGPNGASTVLTAPQKISFDGQALAADSTVEKEYFYEIQVPIQNFTGTHTIVFLDKNEEEQTDKFEFVPFRLTRELGEEVSRDELKLAFEGLKDGDKLRVVMLDTVFTSNGINSFYPIENGKLDLRNRLEGKIQNGPVLLQLFKEVEKTLDSDPDGGQIAITYSLKREFELKD